MLGWTLNVGYGLLLVALTPWLLWRRFRSGKDREGLSSKLWGWIPTREGDAPCVWLHAVSVGEVLQLVSLVEMLKRDRSGVEVAISVTTQSGMQVARRTFPDERLFYAPLDFTWAVDRVLSRLRPDLLLLVELELWPNLISRTRAAGVPVAVVNGRLSGKSLRGYSRIRFLMRRLLDNFSLILTQNQTYAERFIALGADREQVIATGSIKWDNVRTSRDHADIAELARAFDLREEDVVLVAGSTQAEEERAAVESYLALRERFPNLRLIVVPRHPERFDEAAGIIAEQGLSVWRRSTATVTTPDTDSGSAPVLLLDTLGELRACWGLADIAFVGGTFSSRGGQNMVEPAAYGAAVVFGPNYWNFQEVADGLIKAGGALCTETPEQLTSALAELLTDADRRHTLGDAARQFVLDSQGATARSLELLSSLLPEAAADSLRKSA